MRKRRNPLLDTESGGNELDWHHSLTRPVFAELADDPFIRAGLDKYAKDEAALRDSVRAFLQTRNQGSSR